MARSEDKLIGIVFNELYNDGYNKAVAEALANRGVTVDEARGLSKEQVLDHYLQWNGIRGWTNSILAVLDNCEDNWNI